MTKLTIMCGWHNKYYGKALVMGSKDGKGQTGITSSICPDCYKMLIANLKETK